MHRLFLPLILLVASLSAQPGEAPVPLVLISIDGLKPDYVIEASKHGLKIPNLRRLVAEGAHATGVHGVVPSMTYPSHTTIVTGVSPARHGILANAPFDPFARNMGGRYWYAEDIRVPTLWDAATDAGMVTSAVAWPVTVGARIRYNIPTYWRAGTPDDQKIIRALATPDLLAEMENALGPYPDGIDQSIESDRRRVPFNVYLLKKKKPRLHFAWLAGLDHAQHEHLPSTPPVFAVLEEVDRLLGDLQRAALDAGGGRATICVVSDHGFAATQAELHLNAALREAGLMTLNARGGVQTWRAFAWNSGGSAVIMLNDPNDSEARSKVRQVLAGIASDPHGGILRVVDGPGAFEGLPQAAFIVGLKEGFRVGGGLDGPVSTTGKPAGTHGFLPDAAAMNASFFVSGPGIAAGRNLGEIDMRDIGPTVASLLELTLPQPEGRVLGLK
jgi:predicted AlkP superfamily pyrophosphatase or phosphodiesterase